VVTIKTSIHDLVAHTGVRFGTSGVRGLVSEMNNQVCYGYARAFLQAVSAGSEPPHAVILGHDLRPSSPRIAAACARAFADAGVAVVYAGALPTPALAYYAQQHQAPAVMITGSHIPFDRNGIKFYRAEGEITKADEQAIQSAVVDVPEPVADSALAEPDARAVDLYIQRYLDFFGPGSLSGMRVALYEHSSVARDVLRRILGLLGAEVISLGRADIFVPIDTEAVRPEDVAQAMAWARQHDFDAILSTDGDADRPLIGDENGDWLRGDIVGILCAGFLQADTVVTPVSSNTAVELCGWFGQVLRTRIGSPYVIAAIENALPDTGGVVAGYEANGGFLLGSDAVRQGRVLTALPTRDAVLPMLALLLMAKEAGCKLSALGAGLPERYTASDRLQDFAVAQSAQLISSLQQDLEKAASLLAPASGAVRHTDTTDGLRMTFANGDIVHLRPSGNAPELRCYAEAGSPESAQALCDACLARLLSSKAG